MNSTDRENTWPTGRVGFAAALLAVLLSAVFACYQLGKLLPDFNKQNKLMDDLYHDRAPWERQPPP
jgi:hypothetical protein